MQDNLASLLIQKKFRWERKQVNHVPASKVKIRYMLRNLCVIVANMLSIIDVLVQFWFSSQFCLFINILSYFRHFVWLLYEQKIILFSLFARNIPQFLQFFFFFFTLTLIFLSYKLYSNSNSEINCGSLSHMTVMQQSLDA